MPHQMLSKLFVLKYQRGISERKKLADELGISIESLSGYESRLDEMLIAKLGEISPGKLNSFCPECLNMGVYEDPETGERVCHTCGAILDDDGDEEHNFDERLDFDTTYALVSDLAFGKSLGDTLPRKGFFKVLEKNGREDIGLRVKQMRILTKNSADAPELAVMLEKANQLSMRLGLGSDKIFCNDLGKNVRRAFWLTRELGMHLNGVADTALWLTLQQYGKHTLAQKIEKSLKVNPVLFDLAFKLNALLLLFQRRESTNFTKGSLVR